MDDLRKRMERPFNTSIIQQEEKKTFFQKLTDKVKIPKLNVKGAKFKEYKYKQTKQKSEYDIRSLWILHGDWWIRKKIVWLIEWRQFDFYMTVIIIANSIMLACTDYKGREFLPDKYFSERNQNIEVMSDVFTTIFLIECVLKILGMGFCLHKNSYLREFWNQLDFVVVVVSVLGWIPGLASNQSIKSLRIVRLLRPLRTINSIPSLRNLIQSLLLSLPGLRNITVFLFFGFLLFGIFGSNQFVGTQYKRCRMSLLPTLIPNQINQYEWIINHQATRLCYVDKDCEKMLKGQIGDNGIYKCGDPTTYNIPIETDNLQTDPLVFYNIPNFDHIYRSVLTVIQCMTMSGWTGLMYNFMDCNNYWTSVIYFSLIIILFSWFAIQIVLAQIMETFAQQQEYLANQAQNSLLNSETKKGIKQIQLKLVAFDSQTKVKVNPSQQLKDQYDKEKEQILEQEPQLEQQKEDQQLNGMMAVGILKKNIQDQNQENQNLNDQSVTEISPQKQLTSEPEQAVHDEKLNQWITNKKVKIQETLKKKINYDIDSEDEYENENKYEIQARDRSKKDAMLRIIYKIVNSKLYNFVIFIFIVANTAALAAEDNFMSRRREIILALLNDVFTWVFTADLLFKILGLGFKNFINDRFNVFDTIVVSLSIIEWVLSHTLTSASHFGSEQIMKSLKSLRLLRIIKIARSWQYLQYIIGTIAKSIKNIFNFAILYFLFLYIFGLIGMEMFSHYIKIPWSSNMTSIVVPPIQDVTQTIQDQNKHDIIVITPHYNFDNIFNAMLVCFQNNLGDDWTNSMYTFALAPNQYQPTTLIYFFVLFICGGIIMLSLFTGILLQNFQETDQEMEERELREKLKPKFNLRTIFSIDHLIQFINSIFKIFDPKASKRIDSKKKEQDRLLNKMNLKKFDEQKQVEALQKIGLRDELFRKKTAIQKVNMLHYELKEKALEESQYESFNYNNKLELEGNALFCFSPKNSFRIACATLVNNKKYFENFILLLIIISSICLALDQPLNAPDSQITNVLHKINYVMTGFFICEMLSKCIAHGFLFCGKNSYIRSGWSILDFIVVILATISIIFESFNASFIKSLRILRVLRPLRLISRNKGLKQTVSTLINSLPNVTKLLYIIIFFIFLWSILSLSLFSGQLWNCQMTQLVNTSIHIQAKGVKDFKTCLMYGGEWVNNDFSFDNIQQSLNTILSILSTENWVTLTWYIQDSIAPEIQPQIDSNRYLFDSYMVLQQLFLTLICQNLFVGVVIDSYNQEQDRASMNSLLEQIEIKWIQNLKLCYSAKPQISTPKKGNKFQNICIDICDSQIFQNLVYVLIVTLVLNNMFRSHSQSIQGYQATNNVNTAFIAIFTVEAILKIYAYRKNYFRVNWNILDFSVVIVSWIVFVLRQIKTPLDLALLSSIARGLRILRILRLVQKIKSLQVIINTLYNVIPSIISIVLLFLLVIFAYAIIGMQIFPFVMWSNDNSNTDQLFYHYNFQDFLTSFLLLVRNSTGEGWNLAMFDCARNFSITFQCNKNADYYSYMNNGKVADGCGQDIISFVYFQSYFIIAVNIFLNMFIAAIIDEFLKESQNLNMPVNEIDVSYFISCWHKFDRNGEGEIKCSELEKFIIKLAKTKSRLIPNKNIILDNAEMRNRFLAKLDIPTHNDKKNFVFDDVLFCLSRQVIQIQYIKEQYSDFFQTIAIKHNELREKIGKEAADQEILGLIKENKLKDYKKEFRNQIDNIGLKSQKIAIVDELFKICQKISEKRLETIDKHQYGQNNEYEEIFTSRHYIYGRIIVRCWREYVKLKTEKKQNNINAISKEEHSDSENQMKSIEN